MKNVRGAVHEKQSEGDQHPALMRSNGKRARNIVLAFFIVPIFLILIGGALLLYFFQGEEISSATVNQRVQETLQTLLGDDFDVAIDRTGLSFVSTSALSLDGDGVVIKRERDGAVVANIDHVEVGLNILSVLQGTPRFDKVTIKGGRINLEALAVNEATVVTLDKSLASIGAAFVQIEKPFLDEKIRIIELTDIIVSGAGLLRRNASDLVFEQATLGLDKQNQLNVNARVTTPISTITANINWRGNADGGKQLSIGAGGIDGTEWFEGAEVLDENRDGVGLNGQLRMDARVPFNANIQPMLPFVKIQTAGAKLRLGPIESRDIGSAVFNVQLNPNENRIELQPSDLSIGGKRFRLNANLQAMNADLGLAGPLEFKAVSLASKTSEVDGDWPNQTVNVSGQINPQKKRITLFDISAVTGEQAISGNMEIGFGTSSPSVIGSLSSALLSSDVLLEAWPFHIAPNIQNWIAQNINKGLMRDFSLKINVEEGRLKEVAGGKGFNKDEFGVTAGLEQMSVNTVGDLPSLEKANGALKIIGSQFDVTVTEGILSAGKASEVIVQSATLKVPNIFQPGVPANLEASLSGDLGAVATISDLEPLNIAKTVGLTASDLSGKSKVKLALDLHLQKTENPQKLVWKTEVDQTKAASKSEVFGRKISNGNVSIKANPQLVEVIGTANIDGFDATLDISEPLKGGDGNLRKRNIQTQLTHEELAKQGINIAPVVKGRLGVEIISKAGEPDSYKIDLTNADVNLPWISWLKGKGIGASVSFALSQKDGINTLSNFNFSGDGFNAQGTLVFGKPGLLSVDLSNVTLVKGDKFDVSAKKEGNRYVIAAQGRAFDARAIINMVIHKSGLNAAKGSSDVTLSANFGQLKGFNNQMMENALVNYKTENGTLSSLEMRGALNGQLSKIDARRNGATTEFNFEAKDAGASLALVNIYSKMRGGNLKSQLTRNGNGPFEGEVKLKKFTVIGEERLSSLAAAPVTDRSLQSASGKLRELNLQEVRFDNMEATITKSTGYLGVKSGRIRNNQIGLTFDGVLFDQQNQMNVRGTFMPLFAVSRVIGAIPIIGDILSNGKNSGLIGITYRLRGAANNPQMAVNPLSIMAPGVFKQIFQFQE